MKKFTAVMLSLLMSMALFAGCGDQSGTQSDSAQGSAAPAIQSGDDLAGKKVGVQGGTTGETWVQENVQDVKLNSYNSGMDAALDLKNGAIDAIVLDELPAKAIVAQNPDLMVLDLTLTTEEYAIAVKKGNTALLESINAAIAKMKENGEYDALCQAFIPADGNIVIPEAKGTEGSETIKMGTNAAFPPFEYVEGSDIVGFDISMSQDIAEDMGKKLEIVDMKFDALLSALDAGNIDFAAAGMSATEERKQHVDFSESYYSSAQVIIVQNPDAKK